MLLHRRALPVQIFIRSAINCVTGMHRGFLRRAENQPVPIELATNRLPRGRSQARSADQAATRPSVG